MPASRKSPIDKNHLMVFIVILITIAILSAAFISLTLLRSPDNNTLDDKSQNTRLSGNTSITTSDTPVTTSQTSCPLENTLNGDYVTLTPELDHCIASFPLDELQVRGYTFTYPSGWTISVRGANGANLGLASPDKAQEVYFHTSSTNLAFNNIDEAYYWSYETAEKTPIISSNEIVTEKSIIDFAQIKVLLVKTQDNDNLKVRYFLVDENNPKGNEKGLYVLEYKSSADTENLITPVKDQILSTFKFLDNE